MNQFTSSDHQKKRQTFYSKLSNTTHLDSNNYKTEKKFLSQGQLLNYATLSQAQLESHIEQCLSYLNQSCGANLQAQQQYIGLLKCKTTLKAKKIKQVYKNLSQNKANKICFQKFRGIISKLNYDYSSQESIFRLYVRLIEKITTKIAYYLLNSQHLSFMALGILQFMKKIEICLRRIHNFKDLSFLFDIINKVFEENKILENKIYQAFINKGFLTSLEQYFQINGIDIQHRQNFSPKQHIQQKQCQQVIINKRRTTPKNDSSKNTHFSDHSSNSKKKIDKSSVIQKRWAIKKSQFKVSSYHSKINEINQQIQAKLGKVLELFINQNKQMKIHQTLVENDQSQQSEKFIADNNNNLTVGSINNRLTKILQVRKSQKQRQRQSQKQRQNISFFLSKDFQKILKNLSLSKIDVKSEKGIKLIQSHVYELISNQNPDRLFLKKDFKRKQNKKLTWDKGQQIKGLLKQSFRRQSFMIGKQLSQQLFNNFNNLDDIDKNDYLIGKFDHNNNSKGNYSIMDMQFPIASSVNNDQNKYEIEKLQKKKTNQPLVQKNQNFIQNTFKSSPIKQNIKIQKQRKTKPHAKLFLNIFQGQIHRTRNFNSLSYSSNINHPLANLIYINNLANDIKQHPNIVFDNTLLKYRTNRQYLQKKKKLNKAIYSFNYDVQLNQLSSERKTQESYLPPTKKQNFHQVSRKNLVYHKSHRSEKKDYQQNEKSFYLQNNLYNNQISQKNIGSMLFKKSQLQKKLKLLQKGECKTPQDLPSNSIQTNKTIKKQNSLFISKNKNSSVFHKKLTDVNFYRIYDSRRRVFLR